MSTRTATGPNGEKITFRSATNKSTGETKWVQVSSTPAVEQPAVEPVTPTEPVAPVPEPEPYQPVVKPQVPADPSKPWLKKNTDQLNQQVVADNEFEQSLVSDHEKRRLRDEAAEMGTLESIGSGFGNVAKQLYAGTLQSPDFLPASIQSVLDYKIGGDNSGTREEDAKAIDDAMGKHNTRYNMIRRENPVSTSLGEIAGYLGTGVIGDKGMSRLAKGLGSGVSKLNRAIASPAEKLRLDKVERPDESMFQRNIKEIAKGTAVGAGESLAMHNGDLLTDTVASGLGSTAGVLGPLSAFGRVESTRDAAGKKLIKEMEEDAIHVTPGVRTGHSALQEQEAAYRNSDTYGQDYKRLVDIPNQKRMTAMVGDAIGLPLKGRQLIQPEELRGHMKNLKEEYQTLEANTTGRIEADDFSSIKSSIDEVKPSKYRNVAASDIDRHRKLSNIYETLKKDMQFVGRDPKTGKFTQATFDGSKYQNMARRINEELKQAYGNNDQTAVRILKDMKSTLDSGIESGLGEAGSKQWKDLNERYAMTNFVVENGLRAHGKVDPRAITNAVMSNDEAMRTMTKQGGRIQELQKIARYNEVLDDVEGGNLTGLGTADSKRDDRGSIRRARDFMLKPKQEFELGYKTNRLSTPFIGKYLSPAHGLNQNTIAQISRAGMMGSPTKELYEDTRDSVKSNYEKLLDIMVKTQSK